MASKDDGGDAELFRALPHSYGTLGYILSVKMEVIPVTEYVRVDVRRHRSVMGKRGQDPPFLSHGRTEPRRGVFYLVYIVFSVVDL